MAFPKKNVYTILNCVLREKALQVRRDIVKSSGQDVEIRETDNYRGERK